MKYIVLKKENELDKMITFPSFVSHADMAKYLGRFGRPISAGFIQGESGEPYISEHGSESLMIKKNKDRIGIDEHLLKMLLLT